jgi:hypothetical protein
VVRAFALALLAVPSRAAAHLSGARLVSRAFPSCTRSILTEIYLCHACSDHEIEDMETPGQVGQWTQKLETIRGNLNTKVSNTTD